MTPSEIELLARQTYNAVNDTFWSQAEIFNYIYLAQLELCGEEYSTERTYTSSTAIGTQDYDFPTYAVALKRVTFDGRKLTKIDLIEDDAITGLNQNTTDTGYPEYYWVWNRTIFLRPVPSSVGTLKLWTFNQPSPITSATQTLDVDSEFHGYIVDFLNMRMAIKDKNLQIASWYEAKWERNKEKVKAAVRKKKRADKFSTVKDENMVVETSIGG